jgi:hypothetical protein
MNPPRLEGLDTNKKLAVLFCAGLAASGCYQAVAGSVHTDQTPLGAGGLRPSAGGQSGAGQGSSGSAGASGGSEDWAEIPPPGSVPGPGDDPFCLTTTEGVPSCEGEELLPIAEASDFGPDAKFVGMRGSVALIDRGERALEERFAALFVSGSGNTILYEFDGTAPGGPYEVREAWETAFSGALEDVSMLALVCAEANCQVWGAYVGEEVIHPLTIAEPPLGGQISALSATLNGDFCVLGDAVACMGEAGSWDVAPPLPEEMGTRLVQVVPGSGSISPTEGLTDTGVLVEREAFGEWTMRRREGLGPVISLDHGILLDETGRWSPDNKDMPELICSNPGVTEVQSREWGQYLVRFPDGTAYVRDYRPSTGKHTWCKTELGASVLDTWQAECKHNRSLVVLTEDRLVSHLGTVGCLLW